MATDAGKHPVEQDEAGNQTMMWVRVLVLFFVILAVLIVGVYLAGPR